MHQKNWSTGFSVTTVNFCVSPQGQIQNYLFTHKQKSHVSVKTVQNLNVQKVDINKVMVLKIQLKNILPEKTLKFKGLYSTVYNKLEKLFNYYLRLLGSMKSHHGLRFSIKYFGIFHNRVHRFDSALSKA